MNSNAIKIRRFQKSLIEWYRNSGRTFDWRKEKLSPYEYVIAEILLQRTKAETVAKFYPLFIETFPAWEKLAMTPISELENFLKPIGLYRQRASRLSKLAKEISLLKGDFPRDRNELEAMPFIGQYIANAIELLIFEKTSPLLDVNMARVIERVFEPRALADIRYDPKLQALARDIVNHDKSRAINWAILDFAALICTARKPRCEKCFLTDVCNYYKKYVAAPITSESKNL